MTIIMVHQVGNIKTTPVEWSWSSTTRSWSHTRDTERQPWQHMHSVARADLSWAVPCILSKRTSNWNNSS